MPIEFQIQWHDQLPSTNTYLREQVDAGHNLPSGTVVAARLQTRGRGRHNRSWLSSTGQNLTFSLLLRGDHELRHLPSASMAAAIAVAELLEAEGVRPALKWPNDVLVDGKKICGILSETTGDGLIIGIGLNVNMQDTGHIDQPATSLLIETGRFHDIAALLERLLPLFSHRLDDWARGGFPQLRKPWETRIPSLGKPVTVRDGEATLEGLLTGFGEEGELLLTDKTGTVRTLWAGDLSR